MIRLRSFAVLACRIGLALLIATSALPSTARADLGPGQVQYNPVLNPPYTFFAPNYVADNRQHIFAAHIFSFRMRVRRFLLIDDNLSNAVAISQIDKRQRSEVPPPRAPTHQGRALTYVFLAQCAARVRAFTIVEIFDH